MDLTDKRVVITGASSGIGHELAKKVAGQGGRVIAAARSIEKADFGGSPVTRYPCDISKHENIDALFDFAQKHFNGIDLFISNAGFAYYGAIKEPDWQEIDRIYRTNVYSTIYMSAKMKALHGKKPFRMVITASAMSFLSYPGYSLYASTKAALHGFATGYRSELCPGQTLQMVYPIGTRTNFFQEAGDKTPVPWPTQTPEKVAAEIIKGVASGKQSIFPSKTFQGLNILNGILPVTFKLIIAYEDYRFKRWLAKNA